MRRWGRAVLMVSCLVGLSLWGVSWSHADLRTCSGVTPVAGQLVCENFETISLGNLIGDFGAPSSQPFIDLVARGWSGVSNCPTYYCVSSIVSMTGADGNPTRALRFRYEEGPNFDQTGTGLEAKIALDCAFYPASPLCTNPGGIGREIYVAYNLMMQTVPASTPACTPNCPATSSVHNVATKQHYWKSDCQINGLHCSFSFLPDFFFGSKELPIAVQADFTNCDQVANPAGCTYNLYENTPTHVSINDNHWYCIQYHVRMNTPGVTDGAIELSIDGTQVVNYQNRMIDKAGNPSWMDFFMWYRQSGGFQWRFEDNLLIGTQAMNCASGGGGPPPPPDTTPPTVPGTPTLQNNGTGGVTGTFAPSTDPGTNASGLASYTLLRCVGTSCAAVSTYTTLPSTATSFTDAGTSASTTYGYALIANDNATNHSLASPTAYITTTAGGGTVNSANETFTHADAAGSITADQTWTQTGTGTWSIVSNQASISGAVGAVAEMGVNADSSTLTMQCTLVSLTRSGGLVQAGVMASMPGAVANTGYFFWGEMNNSGTFWELGKFNAGVFGGFLASGVATTISPNSVLAIAVNPNTGLVSGSVGGTVVISGTDAAPITGNLRAGIQYGSDTAGNAAVMDNCNLSPATVAANDGIATETFTHAAQAGSLSADLTWGVVVGSAQWGINGSNQAAISGASIGGASNVVRATVPADTTTDTVQATLVSFGPIDPAHLTQAGISVSMTNMAGNDDGYQFLARSDGGGQAFHVFKILNFGFSEPCSAAVQAIGSNRVMKLAVNPGTGSIVASLDGTPVISCTDGTPITGNFRGGLDYFSNDGAAAVVFDNWSLTPVTNSPTIATLNATTTTVTVTNGIGTAASYQLCWNGTLLPAQGVCTNYTLAQAPGGVMQWAPPPGVTFLCAYAVNSAGVVTASPVSAYQCMNATSLGPPVDVNPVVITNPSPTLTLPAGTTQATISATVDKTTNASCRIGTVNPSGGDYTAYASLPNAMNFASFTASFVATGLTNGSSTVWYMRCDYLDIVQVHHPNPTSVPITVAVAASTPDVTPPSDVQNLVCSAISQSQETCGWSASTPHGIKTIASYQVFTSIGTGNTSYSLATTTSGALTTTIVNIPGSSVVNTVVKAIDSSSVSSVNPSNVQTVTTFPPSNGAPPSLMQNFRLITPYSDGALMTADPGTDPTGLPVTMTIEISLAGCSAFSFIYSGLPLVAVVNGLQANTSYCARGQWFNPGGLGGGYSNVIQFVTRPPGFPIVPPSPGGTTVGVLPSQNRNKQ